MKLNFLLSGLKWRLLGRGVSPKSSRQFQLRPKISDWIREFDATTQKIKKIANCLINGLQDQSLLEILVKVA
jgi:hypothetical protein